MTWDDFPSFGSGVSAFSSFTPTVLAHHLIFLPSFTFLGFPMWRVCPWFDCQKEMIMLILTRRIGENLRIGTDVMVTILDVKGRQVRVGIDAPRSLPVHREEVYERIQKEREAK